MSLDSFLWKISHNDKNHCIKSSCEFDRIFSFACNCQNLITVLYETKTRLQWSHETRIDLLNYPRVDFLNVTIMKIQVVVKTITHDKRRWTIGYFLGNLKTQLLVSLRHPKIILNSVLFSLFVSLYTAKTLLFFASETTFCIWWFSISCFQVSSAVRIDLKY